MLYLKHTRKHLKRTSVPAMNLPAMDLRQGRGAPMRFPTRVFKPSALPLAGGVRLRVAQLTGKVEFQSAEIFAPQRWHQLEAYAPNILAGSASDLHRLVERMDLGTVVLTSVDHSIYVLTEIGDKPLDDVLRVVLWQRFGVPVFEMYTDGVGTILAHECEAQEGWHVVPGTRAFVHNGELVVQSSSQAIRTGLFSYFNDRTCVCGRGGMRVMQVPQFEDEIEQPVLAATA